MEEDVEIEMLLKSEEKLLLEAVNSVDMQENHLETQSFTSYKEKKYSFNKENMIYNECKEISSPSTLTPKIIEKSKVGYDSNIQPITSSDNIYNNFRSCLTYPNSFPNIDSRHSHQIGEIYHEGADDQVNQHMLDLIATDPAKYFLSRQISYVSQFQDGESDDDKNFDENKSSDEDWEDDYEYKDDESSDDMMEEEFKFSKTANISSNQVLQQLHVKAVPSLTSLGKSLVNRGKYLANLEKRLQQLYQENLHKLQELQSLSKEKAKIKPIDLGNQICRYRLFGIPYFADEDGFNAPPNQDYLQKMENDEIMIHSIPKTSNWTKVHKDLMINAIKKTLLTEKSNMLTKEITKLTDKLKCKKGNASKLLEKIITKQNELRALYKKSFKELVESEKDDREYDWMKFSISLYESLHSAEECRRFWNIYVKPSINKGPWNKSEDKRLLEIANNSQFQDWVKIAKLLGTNRSAFQCFVHFQTRIEGNSDLSNGKWSKLEDKKLKTVVNSSKVGDFIPWSKVSAYVGHRNPSQIYNRWANSLNPEIVKGRFTKEEDILIVTGVEVFGVTFQQLALFLTNRTSCQIRERYERHLLPKTAKVGVWSLDEDNKLLKLVQEFGEQNWAKIADIMKTRSRTQVRQRYAFIKKMKKKNPDWTVAQVKRRRTKVYNKAEQTEKEVENLKKIVGNVERVFNLSGIEKETYIINKLLELQEKISRKHGKGRNGGRKKKVEHNTISEVDDSLQSYFSNCNIYSSLKKMKPSQYNSYEELNGVILMSKFFGHKIKLPKSKEEVINNSRLSWDMKCYVLMLLDANSSVESNCAYKQQSNLSSKPSVEKNSLQSINCSVPENDMTIIMMDWWHTPPISVTNLNFSEFFKRTVFDYSNGMHKDIWDSKVRRSQMVNEGDDFSEEHADEGKPDVQNDELSFPLNHFSILTLRNTLITRKYFKKYFFNECPRKVGISLDYDLIKEEIRDDKPINERGTNLSPMVKNNLIVLLTWAKISSVVDFGLAPMDITRRVQKGLKKYKMGSNTFGLRKRKVIDKKHNCPIKNVCQPEDIVKKRRLELESKTGSCKVIDYEERNMITNSSSTLSKITINNEDQNLSVDNVYQSEPSVKRRKMDKIDSCPIENVCQPEDIVNKKKLEVETKMGTNKVKDCKELNILKNSSSTSSKRTMNNEDQNLSVDNVYQSEPSVKKKLTSETKIILHKEQIVEENNVNSNNSFLVNQRINGVEDHNLFENTPQCGPVVKKKKLNSETIPYRETNLRNNIKSKFTKENKKSSSLKKSICFDNLDSKKLSASSLNVTSQNKNVTKMLRSSTKRKSSS